MGSSSGLKDEEPMHYVSLSSFYIGKYEVTQEEWEIIMGTNPSIHKGDKFPVEQVSWNDCQEFIRLLNIKTGKHFRLPTEAEWEFAARGGNLSSGYEYSGSNNIFQVAWISSGSTREVGTKGPNELGLYDMSGNVSEWCQDLYGNYVSNAQTNPLGPLTGSNRVVRGGCWNHDYRECLVSNRRSHSPSRSFHNLGFRLAL